MDEAGRCPECGAAIAGETCQDRFHRMLAWEFENPALGAVHHLTVLCYHLQHPSLCSPEGLRHAITLLTQFVAEGADPRELRRRQRAVVDSQRRTWPIRGTDARHGGYDPPVRWTLTTSDVSAAGLDGYDASVRAWACAALSDLRATGHAPSS